MTTVEPIRNIDHLHKLENYLAYYKFRLNSSTGEISATVQKIDYSDLIKYEFINNSTVTQTATSLSSSNSKKL